MVTSNCRKDRMDLIRKLVPEDLVEYCGKCAYGKLASSCSGRHDYKEASFVSSSIQPYRFYIALENTICPNYHTEKIFRSFQTNTIPILWNVSQYDGKFRFKVGQYWDLSHPNCTKDGLRQFVESHQCNDNAFDTDHILQRTVGQEVCRFAETLFLMGNVSSQTSNCAVDCAQNWGCKPYN